MVLYIIAACLVPVGIVATGGIVMFLGEVYSSYRINRSNRIFNEHVEWAKKHRPNG